MLLSCKQAYFEARDLHVQAIPVFWSTAHFTMADLGRPRLMRQLKHQRAENLEHVRHVTITVPAFSCNLTVTAEHVPARIPHGRATWKITVSDELPPCLAQVRRELINALMMARDSVTSRMSTQLQYHRAGGILVKQEHVRTHELLEMVDTCRRFAGGRRAREITNFRQRQKIRRLPGATRESHALVAQAFALRHSKFDD